MSRDQSASARVQAASQEAFDLAIDSLHDSALQEALFRRLDEELRHHGELDCQPDHSDGVRDPDFGLVKEITHLKIRIVSDGMHPDERLVEFIDAAGVTVQTFAWRRQISVHGLEVGELPLHRADGACLIELPQETIAGAWRAWVTTEQLVRRSYKHFQFDVE